MLETTTKFTNDEKRLIDTIVKLELDKDRKMMVEAEINNRIADARNSQLVNAR